MKYPSDPSAQVLLDNLKKEISLNRDFVSLSEGALLSLVFTQQHLDQLSNVFFRSHGMTAAQFNLLMILRDYRARPMRQVDLARLLLVNRASAGEVIARTGREGWISRSPHADDRRAKVVHITPKGIRALNRVKGPYYRMLARSEKVVPESHFLAAMQFMHLFRGYLLNARTSLQSNRAA